MEYVSTFSPVSTLSIFSFFSFFFFHYVSYALMIYLLRAKKNIQFQRRSRDASWYHFHRPLMGACQRIFKYWTFFSSHHRVHSTKFSSFLFSLIHKPNPRIHRKYPLSSLPLQFHWFCQAQRAPPTEGKSSAFRRMFQVYQRQKKNDDGKTAEREKKKK